MFVSSGDFDDDLSNLLDTTSYPKVAHKLTTNFIIYEIFFKGAVRHAQKKEEIFIPSLSDDPCARPSGG